MEKNILNFKRYINNDTNFIRLSDKFKVLKDIIGYSGIEVTPLPVEQKIFGRVVERGKKFYKLFGWSDDKIVNRSKIICTSEALVGIFLKENMKNGIMIYTPTMLERLQIYNGKLGKDSLPIIVLKKEENDDK